MMIKKVERTRNLLPQQNKKRTKSYKSDDELEKSN